jgi:signal transduction histidine kinase
MLTTSQVKDLFSVIFLHYLWIVNLNSFSSKTFNNKLGQRLLIYILISSSILSLIAIGVQLYSDYRRDLDDLERRFENIQSSYVAPLAKSLWDFNEALLEVQIQGIVKLPDIRFAKITSELGKIYQAGDEHISAEKSMSIPIFYDNNQIGSLEVFADYQDIYTRLKERAGFIIITQLILVFLVTFLIIFIVHKVITRHIFQIIDYYRYSGSDLSKALRLVDRPKKKDELDFLVESINRTRIKLQQDIQRREEAENALINLSADLEIKVFERTEKLVESNKKLQQSLDDLMMAKDQLVQAEKMASLGQLVAGVAHEVNTPLGICVTSISALEETVEQVKNGLTSKTLTKEQLTHYLELLAEYQRIIARSINKAVELIRSFKSVAVEQHSDIEVEINLAEYVHNVVRTVRTMFKGKNYHINVKVDESLRLVTFPSAWNQILTNFMVNSHIHGFDGRRDGTINIIFSEHNGELILTYCDDGKGIDETVQAKIFDPFVTTKRGQGGSGLGLNIVFNLVNAKLGGSIKLLNQVQGCCFEVRVPINN